MAIQRANVARLWQCQQLAASLAFIRYYLS